MGWCFDKGASLLGRSGNYRTGSKAQPVRIAFWHGVTQLLSHSELEKILGSREPGPYLSPRGSPGNLPDMRDTVAHITTPQARCYPILGSQRACENV